MLYLLAFFLPPLALLISGKPFQAIISGFLYILSWIGFFMIFVPGFLLWIVLVIHAILVINGKRADDRAKKVIDAMRQA